MWTIQIDWFGKWLTIQADIETVNHAERLIDKWWHSELRNCKTFRVVHQDDLANGKVAGAPLKSIDSEASK